MEWNEIRDRYPRQWLLVDALEAHSEAGRRILDNLEVVQSFPDSRAAMESYKEHHREDRQRELYVLHTDREKLDIEEARWLGVRISRLVDRMPAAPYSSSSLLCVSPRRVEVCSTR